MAVPDKFYVPWSEIDPDGQHGGIEGELAEFVGPDLGDNPKTKNVDMVKVFSAVRDCAASLSMAPTANMEGPPVQNIVEETLRAFNWIAEVLLDRTRTQATPLFQWTHAVPPYIDFTVRPIRFPLRNPFCNDVVFHLLGMLVETAESNANALHACLDPSSSFRLIAPLYHMKANVIRDWFDQEVAGEISLDELNQIFLGVARPGPTIVPSGESHGLPDSAAVAEVLTGVDTLQWYPTQEHWAIFARKQVEIYKPERIWQPEGATATTEDVAPHDPIPTGGTIEPG